MQQTETHDPLPRPGDVLRDPATGAVLATWSDTLGWRTPRNRKPRAGQRIVIRKGEYPWAMYS